MKHHCIRIIKRIDRYENVVRNSLKLCLVCLAFGHTTMADDRLQNHPLVKVIFDGSEGNSPNKQAGTNADAIFHQSNADDASQKLESSSPQVAASQQAQQPATGDVNPQSKNRYSIPVQSAPASSGMKSDVPKPPLQTQPHDKQSQPDEGSLIDQPPGAHHGTADKQNYYTSQNAHITTSEFGDGHAPRYNNEFTGVGEYSSYNPAQAASDSFHAINNCAPQLHGSGMYGGYGAEVCYVCYSLRGRRLRRPNCGEDHAAGCAHPDFGLECYSVWSMFDTNFQSQLPPYPSIGGRNFPTPFVIGDESIGPMQVCLWFRQCLEHVLSDKNRRWQTPPNPGSYAPLPTQIKSIPSPILAPREEFCDRSEALRLYNQSYTQAPTSPYDQGHQGQSRVSSYQGHNQQLSHQPYSWVCVRFYTCQRNITFIDATPHHTR